MTVLGFVTLAHITLCDVIDKHFYLTSRCVGLICNPTPQLDSLFYAASVWQLTSLSSVFIAGKSKTSLLNNTGLRQEPASCRKLLRAKTNILTFASGSR